MCVIKSSGVSQRTSISALGSLSAFALIFLLYTMRRGALVWRTANAGWAPRTWAEHVNDLHIA